MIDFERIKLLVENSNKSMNEIDRELGYPRNTLAGLKNRNPSIGRLNEIAEYFNVSTDYLLGNTDIKKSKKEPVDLEELTSDDGINWDEWLSFGGKPISEHDKNKIKEIFGDRLKD